jgi:hypothetical protein
MLKMPLSRYVINDWIKDIDPKEPFSCIVQVDTVA